MCVCARAGGWIGVSQEEPEATLPFCLGTPQFETIPISLAQRTRKQKVNLLGP